MIRLLFELDPTIFIPSPFVTNASSVIILNNYFQFGGIFPYSDLNANNLCAAVFYLYKVRIFPLADLTASGFAAAIASAT